MTFLLYDSYIYDFKSLKILLEKYNKGKIIFTIIKTIIEREREEERISDLRLYNAIRKKIGKKNKVFIDSDKYKFTRAKKAKRKLMNILGRSGYKKKIYKYLDIGVGDGLTTYEMGNSLHAEIYGIDIEDERDKSIKDKFTFTKYDGINIPYAGFDLVTMIMMLHHVSDLKKFLEHLRHSVDGIIIIKDHDIETDNELRLAKIQHQIMCELYGEDAIGTEYECYYSRKEMRKMFKDNGFKLITLKKEKYVKKDMSKFNPTKYYFDVYKNEYND